MVYLEYFYAKMVFRFNNERRMALYRKLSSLLKNNFTLMDALLRLENIESKNGRKPNEPFAIILNNWQRNLEKGMSFADATKWWMPYNETLLLSSGNFSSLSNILIGIVKLSSGQNQIKKSIIKAISYPLLLFTLTFIIVVMVGIYLVPPLKETAGNSIIWKGSAAYLISISEIAKNYWQFFLIFVFSFFILIWLSLKNWTGSLRVLFDKLPPWNIYKINLSVSWIMSLAAMITSGVNITQALKIQSEYSNKYMQDILYKTLHFIINGDNLGNALLNSGTNFPNEEIIGDLIIYSDMNNFNENLFRIASSYLEESIRKIESIANTLNTLGIFFISLIIGWIVFGTFEIQEQITATLM